MVINESRKALEEGLELLQLITNLLSKGVTGVREFLKDIWQKIVDWFKLNLKKFENNETKVEKYLKKSRKIRFKATKMLKKYIGEETGSGWCAPNKVKYLDEFERAKYELSIVEGKLYDITGRLFDTTLTDTIFSRGKSIFVMSKEGKIYASISHKVGEFHHSSFLAGAEVAAAGEIRVVKGILEEVTRKSGHYQPSRSVNIQFIKQLEVEKVTTKNIIISDGF